MCGIIGYLGKQNSLPIILEGLKRMEYRGYDSAGVALLVDRELKVFKKEGKLDNLKKVLFGFNPQSFIGLGHIRWATHGVPSDLNAHPHVDCQGRLAIVHNGIVENMADLKKELLEQGHQIKSQTDSELIAHLIESHYTGNNLGDQASFRQDKRHLWPGNFVKDRARKIGRGQAKQPVDSGLDSFRRLSDRLGRNSHAAFYQGSGLPGRR